MSPNTSSWFTGLRFSMHLRRSAAGSAAVLGAVLLAGLTPAAASERPPVASSPTPHTAIGRRPPANYNPLNLEAHRSPTAASRAVAHYDWSYPLLGNVGAVGNCTIAAATSVAITAHLTGTIGKFPTPTAARAVATWRGLNGDTSDGLTDAQVLAAWETPAGIMGSRIKGWTQVDLRNVVAVKHALLQGALYTDVTIPQAYLLSTPLVWDAQRAGADDDWVAHAVALVGWIGATREFIAVTWGQTVLLPYAWLATYGEGAYAVSFVGARRD